MTPDNSEIWGNDQGILAGLPLICLFLTLRRYGHNQSLYYFLFQIANLEQQVLESSERLKSAEQQITEKQQHMDKLVSTIEGKTFP